MSRQLGKKDTKGYNSKKSAKQQKMPKSIGTSAPLARRGFGDMALKANREKKFYDTTTGAGPIDITAAAAVFKLIHIPTQGTDYTQRIGRKTVIKSVYLRGRIIVQPFATIPPTMDFDCPAQQCRMIVFIDFQPNGAAPATQDVLMRTDPVAHLNPNNRDRFKVIKDKTFVFDACCANASDITAVNRTIHDFKIYKKLNTEVIYNQTNGGTIADITTGALFVMFLGSNTNLTTDLLLQLDTRTRFDDT